VLAKYACKHAIFLATRVNKKCCKTIIWLSAFIGLGY